MIKLSTSALNPGSLNSEAGTEGATPQDREKRVSRRQRKVTQGSKGQKGESASCGFWGRGSLQSDRDPPK